MQNHVVKITDTSSYLCYATSAADNDARPTPSSVLERNRQFASELGRWQSEAPVMCAADANQRFLAALSHR